MQTFYFKQSRDQQGILIKEHGKQDHFNVIHNIRPRYVDHNQKMLFASDNFSGLRTKQDWKIFTIEYFESQTQRIVTIR